MDEELKGGRWLPAVPEPFYGLLHARCDCGRRFWAWRSNRARDRYRDHYAARHLPGGGRSQPLFPGWRDDVL